MAKSRRSARSAAADEITFLETLISADQRAMRSLLKAIEGKQRRIVALRKQNRLENDVESNAESKSIGD